MCFGIVSWPPVLTIVLRFPLSVVLMQVILKRVVKNLFIDYRQVLLQLGGGATSVFKSFVIDASKLFIENVKT